MRVLQINKFFYRRGGVEQVFFDTIAGLKSRGHAVAEFSVSHRRNVPSADARYFISPLPELTGPASWGQRWRLFKHFFRSPEVEQKLSALTAEFQPAVAHLHSVYHHLSASAIITLKRLGVPLVMTLHDAAPLVPNRNFLCAEHLNEQAFRSPLACLRHRCVNNQLLPSAAGELEQWYYRRRRIWQMIDRFICPSEFWRELFWRWGFPLAKLSVIKNPAPSVNLQPLGSTVLYLGRLHVEKGVKILLAAAGLTPQASFVIAGEGPLAGWVKEYLQRHQLTNVRCVGFVEGAARAKVMRAAKVVVVPSIFYENCSLTILEALSCGRLVVATDRGGNGEMIKNLVTGWLVKPEDPADLARVIATALAQPASEAAKIIQQGRAWVERQYSADDYFVKLLQVYKEIA